MTVFALCTVDHACQLRGVGGTVNRRKGKEILKFMEEFQLKLVKAL